MDTLTPIQSLSADGIRDVIRQLCDESESDALRRRRGLSDFVASVDWSHVDREPPPAGVLEVLGQLERLAVETEEGDMSDIELRAGLETVAAAPRTPA